MKYSYELLEFVYDSSQPVIYPNVTVGSQFNRWEHDAQKTVKWEEENEPDDVEDFEIVNMTSSNVYDEFRNGIIETLFVMIKWTKRK